MAMDTINAAISWIREQVVKAGAKGIVLGLSGGIDSAVVAALSRRALGPDVLGLLLPCHSHRQDTEDALTVAGHLGLETVTVDLTPAFDLLLTLLPSAGTMVAANLKPRLRMITLYHFAGLKKYLVAGTGNKSEIAVGYFTKYGDGGADLLPLGDMLKSEVWAMAAQLGLPEAIIKKPPSAGLLPGQTDEGELNISYAELDQALKAIADRRNETIPPGLRQRVEQLMKISEHKRMPVPVFKMDPASG
jgi:NAD+ synthase